MIPPVLLKLITRGGPPLDALDWVLTILLYGTFGMAAMLALGTPLLALYLWFGLTDLLSFMAGGGVCAGITVYAMSRRNPDVGVLYLFTALGIISGAVFRLILFGGQPYSRSASKALPQ